MAGVLVAGPALAHVNQVLPVLSTEKLNEFISLHSLTVLLTMSGILASDFSAAIA